MATRKITWASVANLNGGETLFSSASTRDELYTEFPQLEMASKGMKAWVKDATNTQDRGYGLENGNSRLPEGDVTLYFLVDKNDSGTRG